MERYKLQNFGKIFAVIDRGNRDLLLHDENNQLIQFRDKESGEIYVKKLNAGDVINVDIKLT